MAHTQDQDGVILRKLIDDQMGLIAMDPNGGRDLIAQSGRQRIVSQKRKGFAKAIMVAISLRRTEQGEALQIDLDEIVRSGPGKPESGHAYGAVPAMRNARARRSAIVSSLVPPARA